MMDDATQLRHKKQYGQNFLSDTALLAGIVADAGVTDSDSVIEIGAGIGALTIPLARAARSVLSYEIDGDLLPRLSAAIAPYKNVTIVHEDFLKRTQKKFDMPYKVVANLPYYITTPILFDLLEDDAPPESLSIMVQREVGLRFCARPSTADYGAASVAVQLFGVPRIAREVPARLFKPQPKIDSCVVRIDRADTFDLPTRRRAARVVKAAFCMRRKTLVNNLTASLSLPRAAAEAALVRLGVGTMARGETLSPAQFVTLSQILKEEGLVNDKG